MRLASAPLISTSTANSRAKQTDFIVATECEFTLFELLTSMASVVSQQTGKMQTCWGVRSFVGYRCVVVESF